MEQKKYRSIHIEPVLNGFMCNIGCQRAVYKDVVEMLADLNAYYADPEGTTHKFLENSLVLNSSLIEMPVQVPHPAGQPNY